MYDGFTVDLSSSIVPEYLPRSVDHEPMCRSCWQSEVSPIGQRVPSRLFDTRGASFNPGALAQALEPGAQVIRMRQPTGPGPQTITAPLPVRKGNGNGGTDESFFRNADGTLKTARVVGALLIGALGVGLLVRQLQE